MYFANRQDAGYRLGAKLASYKQSKPIIVSIPRGGTAVAAPIAVLLNAPLYIITPRKIGAPSNREFAVGALAPDGSTYLDKTLLEYLNLTPEQLEPVITAEQKEIARRMAIYGDWGILPDLHTHTIILVDDGIATGQTVKAAIHSLRNSDPEGLVLAVPVLPLDTVPEFEELVNQLVFLEAPFDFRAVGQFYHDFSDVSHEEVVTLLQETNRWKAKNPG